MTGAANTPDESSPLTFRHGFHQLCFLRIRAFVYTGFAFLVIGLTGQLSQQIHGQAGIARAVILITVGLMVLSAMVFFNLKREEILRQYRYFIMSPEWE